MSRQLPEKPNLEYLKKQAKALQRSTEGGRLADAQRALAQEYGFPRWADLKAHVQALALSPAEALKAAVCDMDAARVREVFTAHPELRARIDDPLPDPALVNMRYSPRCSAAIARRSRCCYRPAPI